MGGNPRAGRSVTSRLLDFRLPLQAADQSRLIGHLQKTRAAVVDFRPTERAALFKTVKLKTACQFVRIAASLKHVPTRMFAMLDLSVPRHSNGGGDFR